MSTLTAPTPSTRDDWTHTWRHAPTAGRMLLRLLQRLQHGTLELRTPEGVVLRVGHGTPVARLDLHDWRVAAAVLRHGDIGLAESYLRGQWSSPDVVTLLRLALANRAPLDAALHGHWVARLLHRVRHWLRRNIHAHYDLGNGFYRLWLDDTMTYSAAWFEGDRSQPLEQAQRAKIRRALQACALAPGQRLLEIGCGWGALAEQAAREFDVHVTGITLSREQLVHGMQRIAHAALSNRLPSQAP